MIDVQIIANGIFKKYLPQTITYTQEQYQAVSFNLSVRRGTTPLELLSTCHIPIDEVGFLTINGQKIQAEQPLDASCTIKLYPTILGG